MAKQFQSSCCFKVQTEDGQLTEKRTGELLCWGFTAQSTQWGHVERGQFT